MPRRRKSEDPPDNHERWLVSYADFITLLFAFFVVMYALSTVNEGKYRVLSDSMTVAFRNASVNGQMPLPTMVAPPIPRIPRPSQAARQAEAAKLAAEAERQQRRDTMRNVAKELIEVMAPLIDEGKVRIVESGRGVAIERQHSLRSARPT